MNDDRRARTLVESWAPDERAAVCRLLLPQLTAGWIPTVADLEAAVLVVRNVNHATRSAS